MAELFKLPKFQDSEKTRKAQIFSKIVLGTLCIINPIMITLLIIVPQYYERWLFAACITDFSSLGLLHLNNKGYIRLSSIIFVFIWSAMAIGMAWSAGGIRAPVIQLIPVIVMLAGILLGWKAGLLNGFILVLATLGLVLAEHNGLLPVTKLVYLPFQLWVFSVMIISLIAMIQFVSVASLDKALIDARQELSLRKISESRIKTISDNFNAGMIYQVVINKNGSRKFTYLSDSVQKLYGISPEMGMTDSDLIYRRVYAEDRVKLKEAEENSLKAFSSFKVEVRIKNPAGDLRWSSLVSTPRKLDDGSICFDGIESIITESKLTEETLRNERVLFRTIIDNIPDPIYAKDLKARKTVANLADVKNLGANNEAEVLNKDDFDFYPKDVAKRFWDNDQSVLQSGKPVINIEDDFTDKNGNTIWLLSSKIPIFDNSGKISGLVGIARDITAKKQAEKALLESENKYKRIVTTANEGIIMVDEHSLITYVNAQFCEMIGYSPEEILHRSIENFVYESDLQDHHHKVEQRKLGIAEKFERRFVKKDKSIIWLLVSASALRNNEQKIQGSFAMLTDITERKLAEQSLQLSEERFRNLADLLPQAVLETDREGNLTYVNKFAFELFGYTQEDINNGLNALDILKKEDALRARENMDLVLLQNGYSKSEYTAIKKTGTEFPIIVHSNCIERNHKIIGLRSIIFDITELRQAEKALKESEERYRKLVEAFPDIIMLTDLNGNIIYANEPLERITGITPADYSNPGRAAHIHPDDVAMIRDASIALLASNNTHTDLIENRFIDSWGELHWFSGRIAKLDINGQTVLQTVSRDITEKKIIEKELEQHRNQLEKLVNERTDELNAANEELNAANEDLYNQKEDLIKVLARLNSTQNQLILSEKMAMIGILSAGIAHEINNPLNFIHGGAIGIENYLSENSPEHLNNIKPLINAINTGVKRSTEIVSSLSHYSRNDDLPKVECDIHSIIDDCLIVFNSKLANKVTLKKHYTEKHHLILGNEGKLHQAFLNLIANAEQSIEKTGIINIETEILNKQLITRITDNGCGISQENLKRIFDPFFTTKDPGKGTGLGLPITLKIIQEHDGTLEYESALNTGTTAIIKLPLIEIDKI